MKNADDILTRVLEERLKGARGSSDMPLPPAVTKRMRRAMTRRRLVSALLVVSVASLSYVAVTREAATDPTVSPAAQQDNRPEQAQEPRPTTPDTQVHKGTNGGQPWELRAYLAEIPEAAEEALCMGWRSGQGREPEFTCMVNLLEGLSVDHPLFFRADSTHPDKVAIFGMADPSIDRIELHASNQTMPAYFFKSPDELGLGDLKFWVAFAPKTDVTISGFNEQAEVATLRYMALPLLSAQLQGDGEGSVVGYATGEISCVGPDCQAATPQWVNCPSDCSEELDEAHITLEAAPADGSVFLGWEGACEGEPTTRCSLVVNEDMTVIARFAVAP